MPHPIPTGSRWIALQNDAEWRWILDETAQYHAALGPLSFRDLSTALAHVAASTLVARDPRLQGRLTATSLAHLASGVGSSHGTGWVQTASLAEITAALSDSFLLFAALLLVSMPSPYDIPTPDYWPFGQEGGFCNPMKIKMLDDER